MSETEEPGKEILNEVVELASQYVAEDLDERITEAVKKAIQDLLNKYRGTEGPVFMDNSGLGLGSGGLGNNNNINGGAVGSREGAFLDLNTPRSGNQVLQDLQEIIETDAISPTNPLHSSIHAYSEETDKERKQRLKEEKARAKALKNLNKKSKLDTMIAKEDAVNEKLNKVAYAFLLNAPGVAQVVTGKQLKQQVIVNTDQKPIPVVLVQDLNHSESKTTQRKRRREAMKKALDQELKDQEDLKEKDLKDQDLKEQDMKDQEEAEETGETESEESSEAVELILTEENESVIS